MAMMWLMLISLVFGAARCDSDNDIQLTQQQQTNGDQLLEDTELVRWSYRCEQDLGCQRTEVAYNSSSGEANSYPNVDVCRIVCGRFGALWPRPVTAALSMQTVKIHPNYLRFNLIDVPAEVRATLIEMTHLMTDNLMRECNGDVTELVETPVLVHVTIKSASLRLDWDTKENYMIDVQNKANDIAVYIVADTVYGARHALESFTQLVASTRSEHSNDKECALHLVAGAKIRDRPFYKHRGFLLDTSRNFFPMKDIKRMLDGMAASKMNVFHWHITDSHSFPLESTRVPMLTKYGAYSPDDVYTVDEIKQLVRYAQVRGIRVVLEIDAPAHAGNGWQWGKDHGYGELAVCVNNHPWRQLCIQPPCGQLNPANPAMYRVLRDLYRDVAELLNDVSPTLFHMGGDEVFFPCWNSSATIVNYLQEKGLEQNYKGFIELWAEFQAKALQIWDEEYVATGGEPQPPVMLWSSELTQPHNVKKYLSKDRYIIEVWEPQDSPLLTQLLSYGYKTVSVPKDIWYLDHGFWGQTKYSNWWKMYAYTLPENPNMLGGEVAMWSEYVDSQSLDARVWPRAAAVAERLWSDPTSMANAAEPRMQRHRTRLVSRGLRPDVISPAWCAQHDSRCH